MFHIRFHTCEKKKPKFYYSALDSELYVDWDRWRWAVCIKDAAMRFHYQICASPDQQSSSTFIEVHNLVDRRLNTDATHCAYLMCPRKHVSTEMLRLKITFSYLKRNFSLRWNARIGLKRGPKGYCAGDCKRDKIFASRIFRVQTAHTNIATFSIAWLLAETA